MDVVALGELLVDFTSAGISGQGNQIYEAKSWRSAMQCTCNASETGEKYRIYWKSRERFFWRNVGVGSKRTGNFSRGNLL